MTINLSKNISFIEELADNFLARKVKIDHYESTGNWYNNQLEWDNPENIDNGYCGKITLLIDLYYVTHNSKYLNFAEKAVEEIIQYCKKNPTNNYSLYSGRLGVVYLLIKLYVANKNIRLIHESIAIVEAVNAEVIDNIYLKDDLFDGRSGILLTIFNLYKISKEEKLLNQINLLITKIIENAYLTDHGMFWKNKDETNIKPPCGFAFGTAGIKYVMSQLFDYFQNDSLLLVIREIEKFENDCWIEEYQNWGDFRKEVIKNKQFEEYRKLYQSGNLGLLLKPKDNIDWRNGTIGIGLSAAYALNGKTQAETITVRAKKKILTFINNCIPSEDLGCIGFFLFEAYSRLNDDESLNSFHQLCNQIPTRLTDLKKMEGSLLNGDLNLIYFLIHASMDKNKQDNILLPFNCTNLKNENGLKKLSVSLAETKRTLISRYYGRTISLLENVHPLLFNNFLNYPLNRDANDEIRRFELFLEEILQKLTGAPIFEPLNDLFCLEKSKIDFYDSKKCAEIQIYLRDILYQEKAVNQLNNTTEWLIQQSVAISDTIKIVQTKWNWSFLNRTESSKLLENLLFPPGKFETMLQISNEDGLSEQDLQVVSYLLHRFDSPKTVKQALLETNKFCQGQDISTLKRFAQVTGCKDVEDFYERFQFLMLYKLKELIFNNVLVIVE